MQWNTLLEVIVRFNQQVPGRQFRLRSTYNIYFTEKSYDSTSSVRRPTGDRSNCTIVHTAPADVWLAYLQLVEKRHAFAEQHIVTYFV